MSAEDAQHAADLRRFNQQMTRQDTMHSTHAERRQLAPSAPSARCTTVTVLIVVVIIAIMYLCWASMYPKIPPRDMGKDLAERGWVVYTTPGCTYCEKQMKHLEHYRKEVVCGGHRGGQYDSSYGGQYDGPVDCSRVSAFPFWVNERTQETRTGFQDAKALTVMVEGYGAML
jgi:hypothetical protein